jgi:hypothetical protein
MSCWSIQKTCLLGSRPLGRHEKGTMIIAIMFTFLVFSTLALSSIFLSQVYLRLGGFRKNSVLLEYSSENGLKSGFHHLLQAVSNSPRPVLVSEERLSQLREDAGNSGAKIIEATIGLPLPLEINEAEGAMNWRSRVDGRPENVSDDGDFFSARFEVRIDSEGGLKNFLAKRTSTLETRLGILAGHVPLAFFPFLLNKELNPDEKREFAARNNINIAWRPGDLLPPRPIIIEAPLIPQDASPLLEQALNIKIFRPQDLSNARLRAVLGLENSTDPVPEGVYLIRNDLGLGGVYVQGDVEEMITAIEQDFQVISFRTERGLWLLKFSPSQSKTYFETPLGTESYDLIPLGIIIVSGQIRSLGGGAMDPEGKIELIRDQEIPSLLQGVDLTIIASDKVNITSHLLRQGVKWQEGAPYLKENNGQLLIFSTGREFQADTQTEGGIVIGESSPPDIKIQASLTAQGEGFQIQGERTEVHIMGSLQATDYQPGPAKLDLVPLPLYPGLNDDSLRLPATAEPVLLLSSFETREWKEF